MLAKKSEYGFLILRTGGMSQKCKDFFTKFRFLTSKGGKEDMDEKGQGGCWVGKVVTREVPMIASLDIFCTPLPSNLPIDILWVSLLLLSGLQVQSRPMLELGRKQGLNNS